MPRHTEALNKAEKGVTGGRGALQVPLKHFSMINDLKTDREETAAVWKEARFKCQVALSLAVSFAPFSPPPTRRGK